VQWLVRTVDGREHAQVFTRGAVPRQPDAVFLRRSLAELAREWPDPEWRMLVDRGVPALEWSFAKPALVRAVRGAAVPAPAGRLVSRIDGPREGPLVFGLACAAPIAVHDAVPWNDLGPVYGDYIDRMRTLRDTWGVTDARRWRETVTSLLGGGDPRTSFVLTLRHDEARRTGRPVEPGAWPEIIRLRCREHAMPPETVAGLLDLAARIGRYEERFRADGLLPPDGRVHSTAAHDLARAVTMARWGLEAGFCDEATAEGIVADAGERCRRHYGSWSAVSAGYAMGGVLRAAGEEAGPWYDAALTAHRVLATAAGGPWQTVPWAARA
jgi:hypothetical protein